MPNYLFQSLSDPEIHTDFFFFVKDAPSIGQIIKDEEGGEWKRLATIPQAATSTQISPFDSKAFVEKTGRMKGSWGELEDYSRQMSEERTRIAGRDEVLEKYESQREKQTGLKSFRKRKKEAKENLEKKGIILE